MQLTAPTTIHLSQAKYKLVVIRGTLVVGFYFLQQFWPILFDKKLQSTKELQNELTSGFVSSQYKRYSSLESFVIVQSWILCRLSLSREQWYWLGMFLVTYVIHYVTVEERVSMFSCFLFFDNKETSNSSHIDTHTKLRYYIIYIPPTEPWYSHAGH